MLFLNILGEIEAKDLFRAVLFWKENEYMG